MTRPLVLEEFLGAAAQAPQISPPAPPEDEVLGLPEDDRLTAFEQGYQSGWDDCAAADAEQAKRIGADLAANLKDVTVTHAAARRDVLLALTPFFEELIAQFLPRLAAESLGPLILDELSQLADGASDRSAVLTAAPSALPNLELLLERFEELDVSLEPEPAYAEGQVTLRHDNARRDINMSAAVERISTAIQDFLHQETGGATSERAQIEKGSTR